MAVDRSDDVRNHFVYRAFDAEGHLLYVGCTQNLKARWQQHRFNNRHWVVQTERMKVQGPYPYRTARAIEKAAIESEGPRYGWTPDRGRALQRKKTWTEQRLRELLGGKRAFEVDIETYLHLSKVADDDGDARFPGIHNSDNHPTNGVPEDQQPFLPFGSLAELRQQTA
jgi:predicted GIY-YIG superfamily endonuclease